MLSADSTLYDIAEKVLDVIVDAYDAVGIDPPERRFIAHGTPPFDCLGILAVSMPRLSPGLTQGSDTNPIRCATTRTASLQIWLARCVPVIDSAAGNPIFPDPDELSASAREFMVEGWLISNAIIFAQNEDRLTLQEGTDVSLGDAEFLGPDGGMGAFRQDLRIQAGV